MTNMDHSAARRNMVNCQVRPNMVSDSRILAAMAEIPRETFVPASLRDLAYIDDTLPLTKERGMIEPVALARMLQAAAIRSDDVVLAIGAANGYGAAVISRLASVVVALECDPELVARAEKALAAQQIDTVAFVQGPLNSGHPPQAPYDVIFIEGMVDHLPETLTAQLADGGRLVGVIAGPGAMGTAKLVQKTGDHVGQRDLFDIGIPRLPGFERAAGFRF